MLPSWSGTAPSDLPRVRPGRPRHAPDPRHRAGNLESVKTVDGICELTGYQNKILQLTPEGNRVEKGDIVCRFDSSEIDKSIAKQQIQAKQASSKIEITKQEVEIARNTGERP